MVAVGPGRRVARNHANVASTFPPDSPQDKGLNKFKQLVAERSGGRIEVLQSTSERHGDERSTFEMLSAGSVEYGASTNDVSTSPQVLHCRGAVRLQQPGGLLEVLERPGKELSAVIEKQRAVPHDGVIFRGAALPHRQPAGEFSGDVKASRCVCLGQVPGSRSGRLRRAALDHRLRRGLHGPQDRGSSRARRTRPRPS